MPIVCDVCAPFPCMHGCPPAPPHTHTTHTHTHTVVGQSPADVTSQIRNLRNGKCMRVRRVHACAMRYAVIPGCVWLCVVVRGLCEVVRGGVWWCVAVWCGVLQVVVAVARVRT